MRSPRRLSWLLAVLLLLSQQVGVIHLTLHAARTLADVQGSSHSLPTDCAECAQFSANGAAVAPALPVLHVAPVRVALLTTVSLPVASEPFRPYRSRAPPISI